MLTFCIHEVLFYYPADLFGSNFMRFFFRFKSL